MGGGGSRAQPPQGAARAEGGPGGGRAQGGNHADRGGGARPDRGGDAARTERDPRGNQLDDPRGTRAERDARGPASGRPDGTDRGERAARPAAPTGVDVAWDDADPSVDGPAAPTAPPADDDGPAPAITLGADLPLEPASDDRDPLTVDQGAATADALGRPVATLVGVRLVTTGRVYWCEAADVDYQLGDRVVVEGERSTRVATVAVPPARRAHDERTVRRVLRKANAADLAGLELDSARADVVLRQAKDKARALNLPIKVFRVEYTQAPSASGKGGKLDLYYTSDERVELREFMRDLGTTTGARIELRQVGVRDEAKQVGGIGSCGLELCCSTWLPDFVPVSIKMAKDQGMVLNPTKVSGQCGRLKCCLVYEQATYAEMRKGLPKLGKRVITEQGEGRVVEVDVLRQRVRVAFGPGESQVMEAADVKPMFPAQSPAGRGAAPGDASDDDQDSDDPPDPADAPGEPTRAPPSSAPPAPSTDDPEDLS